MSVEYEPSVTTVLAEARLALGSFDRFLLLYCALFAAFGVASPFLPALLHERGLGPSQISAVFAAGTADSSSGRPFLASQIGSASTSRPLLCRSPSPLSSRSAALSRPVFLLVNRDRRRSAHTSEINNLHVGQSERNRPKSAYTGRT
jgi:hypothetical protein